MLTNSGFDKNGFALFSQMQSVKLSEIGQILNRMHEENRFSSKTLGNGLFHFQNYRSGGRLVLTFEIALRFVIPMVSVITTSP